MRSFKSLLIEEFNKEIEELNKYFASNVVLGNKIDTYEGFFDSYDFEKIKLLFGRDGLFTTPSELLDGVIELFTKKYSSYIRSDADPLLYIPVFVYFLHCLPVRSDEFYDLCMKIHLAKDKKAVFSSNGFKECNSLYNATMSDMLDMTLNSPDFSADLETVTNLLNYINYEMFINGDRDSEYYKRLKIARSDLLTYFTFFAPETLYRVLYKSRNGEIEFCKHADFVPNNAYLKLMSSFIDTKVGKCKNKYLEFKSLEKRLKSGLCYSSRVNNMLLAFTYRAYSREDDFYDAFDDVFISLDDLKKFIVTAEEKGVVLSTRQFENLLLSYRNRQFEKDNLEDEYADFCSSVRSAFFEYRRGRYAFLPDEFIDFYNSEGKGKTLTRNLYEIIINNNVLIGFNKLSTTKSWEAYVSNKPTTFNDGFIYGRDRIIFEKYFHLLTDSIASPQQYTFEYIMRTQVDDSDKKQFLRLKEWFDTYSRKQWDYSYDVKTRTLEKLQSDFVEELSKIPFCERHALLYRYKDYAQQDKVKEFVSRRTFRKLLNSYEAKFIRDNALDLFAILFKAYDSGENLLPIVMGMGLSIEDVDFILGDDEVFLKKLPCFISKLEKEKQTLEQEDLSVKRRKRVDDAYDLFMNFLSDNKSHTIYEFCQNRGIPVHAFMTAKKLLQTDASLMEAYSKKLDLQKRGCCAENDEVLEGIYKDIINGVREDDKVRPFDYLDYRLRTNVPLGKFSSLMRGRPLKADISQFILKNRNLLKYTEESVMGEKLVLSVDGKLHEVTDDEKRQTLDFIDQMQLPHEYKLYNLAVKRFLNGKLKFDSSSKTYVKNTQD